MNETSAVTSRAGRPKDSAKREDIVGAATELFMENGYELTSMEAVAREANVSKLTIYSHFADKKELFRAIVCHRCDKVGMPDSFAAEAEMPPEQALTKIAAHAASIIYRADSLRLQRILYAEASRHPEVVEIFYEVGPKRIRTAFADLLRTFDRQKKLAIPDVARATEQFFSLLKGEKLQRCLMFQLPPLSGEEIAAHVKTTVGLFLAAYRPNQTNQTEKR